MSQTAKIEVPLRVWGRLASEADNRGISIADLLVEAVRGLDRPRLSRSAAVVALARQGFTDREIAEKTGETINYIKTARYKVGLQANRDRGQRKNKETS